MANNAVSNTGPILHLSEIIALSALEIFVSTVIPQEVADELIKNKLNIPKKIRSISLKSEGKDKAKIIAYQHNLDLGESCALALTLQEKADYFLTDDLDARSTAREYNLNVHGTIGVLLRAYKKGIINKKTALEKISKIQNNSSLFITKDLIAQIIKAINNFSKEK